MNKLRQLLRHKFLRDSSTLQAGALITAAGNLLSAVALTHLLGAKLQGQFFIATSLYALLWNTVNLGLYQVTISQVASANARGLERKALGWLAYLVKAYAVIGVVVGALAALVLPLVAEHGLHIDAQIGWWAAMLALVPLMELPRVVVCAALQGNRRMLPLTLIENGQELVRVFLVLLGAIITRDPLGPVLGMLAASGVGSILAIDTYWRESRRSESKLPRMRAVLACVKEVPFADGLRLGVRVGIMRNIGVLATQVFPSLILQRFGTSEWVAYMRIAQRIMNMALMFMQGISRTVLPMFSAIAGNKDLVRLRREYYRASFMSAGLIAVGLTIGMPLVPFMLARLFPADYHEPVWTICQILVPGVMAMSLAIANDTFYLVTNTLKVAILINVVGTLVNSTVVGVLAWLNPTVGAAWGLTFTMLWSVNHLIYATWWFHRNVPDVPDVNGVNGGEPA